MPSVGRGPRQRFFSSELAKTLDTACETGMISGERGGEVRRFVSITNRTRCERRLTDTSLSPHRPFGLFSVPAPPHHFGDRRGFFVDVLLCRSAYDVADALADRARRFTSASYHRTSTTSGDSTARMRASRMPAICSAVRRRRRARPRTCAARASAARRSTAGCWASTSTARQPERRLRARQRPGRRLSRNGRAAVQRAGLLERRRRGAADGAVVLDATVSIQTRQWEAYPRGRGRLRRSPAASAIAIDDAGGPVAAAQASTGAMPKSTPAGDFALQATDAAATAARRAGRSATSSWSAA